MEQASSKVIHDFNGLKKLVSYNPIQGRVVTQSVREEEEYMEHLGKIIQRDFFPDLAPVHTDASNDPNRKISVTSESDSRNPEKSDPTNMSLDKYLANNTTEDDASFSELIEETEKKQRIKLAPFFPSLEYSSDSVTKEKNLALPGLSQVTVGPRITLASSNAVHFNPEGVAQTKDELLEYFSNERRINPTNTRFKRPFPPNLDKKRTAKQLLAVKLGHVGLDGKEAQTPYGTPQAGGYKFMDVSPSPSSTLVNCSPLMTWGELDSTPARLDDGNLTPFVASGAPAFHISSPSAREQLAHRLADKASRQRIRGRLDAVKRMQSGSSSPSRSLLSPAARRLLASSSSILNSEFSSRPSSALSQGSSTNSPLPKINTPRRLPSDLGVIRHPTSERSTPSCPPTHSVAANNQKSNQSGPTIGNMEACASDTPSSITDNLLNLKSTNSQCETLAS